MNLLESILAENPGLDQVQTHGLRPISWIFMIRWRSWNLEDNFRFNDEQIVSEISKLRSKLKVISKVNQTGHSPKHPNSNESLKTVFIHNQFEDG